MKGVKINDTFWDDYTHRLNTYHHMINCNYENGRISLKDKCKAHKNVKSLYEDFFIESTRIY